MLQENVNSSHGKCSMRHSDVIPSHPAMPLYNDVIRVTIGFLSCSELHTVVRLSKQWYEVVKTTKPLGLTTESTELFMIRPYSTVASHVSVAKQLLQVSKRYPSFIRLLVSRLPNLTEAFGVRHVSNSILKIGKTPFQLPLHLQSLDLSFEIDCAGAVGVAVSSLTQLHTLTLSIQDESETKPLRAIDFSTFLPHRLPLLETLALHFPVFAVRGQQSDSENSSFFSSSLVEFIRQSSLVEMRFDDLDGCTASNLLDQLSSDTRPCPLLQSGRLSSIQLHAQYDHFDLSLLPSFVKFPSLQSVGHLCVTAQPDDAQLLSQLPNLTNLELWSHPANEATSESVIAACKYAPPRITGLLIQHERFTEHHLREALPYFPNLTSLELVGSDGIQSLAPLKEFGLPDRLKSLEVWSAHLTAVTTITDVLFRLKQLQHLSLQYAFVDTIPEELETQLQPNAPTCKLPNLKEVSINCSR